MSKTDTRSWVGQRIACIIDATGMPKTTVSERSGIPYSSLNAIIRGYRPVSIDQILRIAEATRVKPTDFLPPEFFEEVAEKEGAES